MILGVPKETLKNETRVAVIPATVKQLISAGFDIFIESGAGSFLRYQILNICIWSKNF